MAVRNGQSMTPALEECDAQERPGVQALSFHVMRHLGHAQALRSQLAKKPPPPEADAAASQKGCCDQTQYGPFPRQGRMAPAPANA